MSRFGGRGRWSTSGTTLMSQDEFAGNCKTEPENKHIVENRYEKFPRTVFKSHGEMVDHLTKEPVSILPVNAEELKFNSEGLPTICGEKHPAYVTFLADLCRKLQYPVTNLKVFPVSQWANHLAYLMDRQNKPLILQTRNDKLFSVNGNDRIITGIEGGNGAEMVAESAHQWEQATGSSSELCGKAYYDETGIHFSYLDRGNEITPLSGNTNEKFRAGLKIHMNTRMENTGRIVAMIEQMVCSNGMYAPIDTMKKSDETSKTFTALMQSMYNHIAQGSNYAGYVTEQIEALNSLALTPRAVEMLRDSGPFSSLDRAIIGTELQDLLVRNGTGLDALTKLSEHSTHRITTDISRQHLAQRFCGELLNPKCLARRAMAVIGSPNLETLREEVAVQ